MDASKACRAKFDCGKVYISTPLTVVMDRHAVIRPSRRACVRCRRERRAPLDRRDKIIIVGRILIEDLERHAGAERVGGPAGDEQRYREEKVMTLAVVHA